MIVASIMNSSISACDGCEGETYLLLGLALAIFVNVFLTSVFSCCEIIVLIEIVLWDKSLNVGYMPQEV